MLAGLKPCLLEETFVFCSIKGAKYGDFLHTRPFACVVEDEGLGLVIPKSNADQEQFPYEGKFRCITLMVHSSLESVGLTSVVSAALASKNISCNVIAGTRHDHLFVPMEQAELAMLILASLEKK